MRAHLISLFDSFPEHGKTPAVVQTQGYRRESRTYAEIATAALLWSHALAGRGIGPGDRVMLWGANSAEWVECFWAILLRRAVAVPMDAGAAPDFVLRAAEQAGARLVLRDTTLPEPAGLPTSLVINDFRDVSSSLSPAGDADADPKEASSRATLAEILFTSGTTAEPRGVTLTHGNFLANLEPLEKGIAEYRKYERWMHPLRFVSLVPLSHVFGQFMGVFVPPLLGATVVFENSAHPLESVRTVKKERATALIAVPRMLDALRSALEREIDARGWRKWFSKAWEEASGESFLRRAWRFRRIHRLFGWRFWAFISGGAALSPETEMFLKRLGYAVVQGYGMTETASLISLNHPFRAAEGSVGKILPGREFKLAEDGEILVRGENVSAGYWENGQVVRTGNEGWLRTGDLGEIDAEGNLRFRGRKKSVIVTPAGLNIYPEDLENALRKRRGVRDCVVTPLERGGNAEPCAVLLLERAEDDVAREIVEGANATLAEYQRMRCWVVWPDADLPRTRAGKPRISLIATRAAELLAGEAPEEAEETFGGLLPASGDLAALSSLDRVELMSALEQEYKVELNETSFAEAKTAEDVKRLIERPASRRVEHVYPRWAQRTPVRWMRLAVYYTLIWPATQILAHPRIMGRHHLKNVSGPVIVISNHITRRADIGLILAALPARFRHRLAVAMEGETLQRMRKPPRNWFLLKRWAYRLGYFLVVALFNVFPLPRLSGFRESFRYAGESADRGYSVLIFPEGVVNNSEDGRMAAFQPGIGLLAENLRLPIVPMRLDGVWRMKKERRRLARMGEVTVHIGAPVSLAEGASAEESAQRLESIVRSL